MKKLFFVAALAAMVFASCERTDSIPADQSKIVVKLNGVKAAGATRSVESPAELTGEGDDESAAMLDNAWVFVISGTEFYKEEMDVTEAMTGGGYTIGEGVAGTSEDYPNKLFPSDSEVYILGNIPSDVNQESLNSWEAVQEAVSVISYAEGTEINTDFTTPAMANASGEPAALDIIDEEAHTASVSINLSPLYSRVELHNLTGGEHIADFTVAGVYINNYYQAFDMTGAGYSDEDLPQYVHAAGSEDFSGAWGDDNEGEGWDATNGVVGENTMTDHAFANAGGGNVWAHNVGAGSVVTFIIRLTDVTYYEEDEDGEYSEEPTVSSNDLYLNVTGYNGISGSFQRGYIYRIDDLEFDHTDLATDPVTGVSITANVTVDNWNVSILEPIVGE